MTAMPKTPVAERKAAMEAHLADLKARLEAIEAELDSHDEQDWEELAIEREGDEVLEATGLSGLAEIRIIEAALARIGAGEYGACTRCGNDIAEARLDVLPWTPFCPACAGASARQGR
jgi:RNA polymerase-binding transcription factor DksA